VPRISIAFTFVAALTICGVLPAQDAAAELLQPFVERQELAGAVALVADAKGTLSVETVGFADIAAREPMKPDALFWIASQSKAMTAAAVMMLVDEGKLSLDDPVEKHLPEFEDQMTIVEKSDDAMSLKKPARSATVRDLLSHMSGLPFSSAIERPTLDGLPLETVVRSYAMTPLAADPGVKYQYSNAGINTAARLIEVLSRAKYEDFMQERLFDPLGMKNTTFWPDEDQAKRLAKSYRPGPNGAGLVEIPIGQLQYPLSDRCRRFPMPAGGLFSTAEDVATFCRMLLNDGELDGRRYLSEDAVQAMTTRQTPNSVKESYGLGLSVGPDWYGHGGAQATNMEVRPEPGLVTVWLVQHAGFPGEGAKAQGEFKTWAIKRYGSPNGSD
jgi:CubicO group peptidase (beta-lactamase class C family)